MTTEREIIGPALSGDRLDRVVALVCDLSRAEAAQLVSGGAVRVNGETVERRSHRLESGDTLEIERPRQREDELGPVSDPEVRVPVLHADEEFIVVDKPAGMVVHPGAGNPRGTLIQGILAQFPEVGGVGEPERPGVVHRLDKGTSGVLVVARTERAYRSLVGQMADRSVERRYLVLVWGRLSEDHGVIDAAIGRSRRRRTRMAVSETGRAARTGFSVISRQEGPPPTTLLECRLETGRTHQIRVHLAAIGHPVVGDRAYGGQRAIGRLDRPWLHAASLGFEHPADGRRVEFSSPLPPELQAELERLS